MPLLIETNLAQQKNSPDLSVARLNLSDTRMGPTAKMPTLKRELDIDAPPHEVWRVLTTPELVREWASVYLDGISIRTTWREGEAVTWKGPSGATHAKGTVAAFRPDRLLKFDYEAGPAPHRREGRARRHDRDRGSRCSGGAGAAAGRSALLSAEGA